MDDTDALNFQDTLTQEEKEALDLALSLGPEEFKRLMDGLDSEPESDGSNGLDLPDDIAAWRTDIFHGVETHTTSAEWEARKDFLSSFWSHRSTVSSDDERRKWKLQEPPVEGSSKFGRRKVHTDIIVTSYYRCVLGRRDVKRRQGPLCPATLVVKVNTTQDTVVIKGGRKQHTHEIWETDRLKINRGIRSRIRTLLDRGHAPSSTFALLTRSKYRDLVAAAGGEFINKKHVKNIKWSATNSRSQSSSILTSGKAGTSGSLSDINAPTLKRHRESGAAVAEDLSNFEGQESIYNEARDAVGPEEDRSDSEEGSSDADA